MSLGAAVAQDNAKPPPPTPETPTAPTPPPGKSIEGGPAPTPTAIDPATRLPIERPTATQGGVAPTFRGPPTAANPLGAFPGTTPGANPLASGAFEEEGNLNLGAAMVSYQSIISRFDGERPEAANAIFRLGECYRKLGRLEEAKVEYARILREFTDQVELVKLSEQHLFAPRPSPAGTDHFITGGLRNQSQFQQRLQAIVKRSPEGPTGDQPNQEPGTTALQDKIESQLVMARQALAGLLTQYADKHPLVVEQRAKVASLERQLTDLTGKRTPPPETAPSSGVHFSPEAQGFLTTRNLGSAAAASPVEREKALIQEQIQLVKKKLAKLQDMRKQNHGLVSDDSIDDVRMQLLSLQRELVEWEAKYQSSVVGPSSLK